MLKQAQVPGAFQLIKGRLDDYLSYLKDFSKTEESLKNMIVQRQTMLQQLFQVSMNYSDLKKFEEVGPRIILSLRSLALKIVYLIKKHHSMKHPEYIKQVKEDSIIDSVKRSDFFFEMEAGQCNILDLMREGKYMRDKHHPSGAHRTQFINVDTFLMKKLAVFL